jgi:uncharacterized membrane protein
MNTEVKDLAVRLLRKQMDDLTQAERRVLETISQKRHISRRTNKEFADSLTLGQRTADRIATFGGSWPLIFIFLGILICWIVLNSVILLHARRSFDPYPYILLNLVLSMLAAIQAPVIMMSQNRQAAKDRLEASHDYEVNLKAELEIGSLHDKLDELRERKWGELLAIQQKQIDMLATLLGTAAGDGETEPAHSE